MVPSWFFMGLAMNPKGWSFLQDFLSSDRRAWAIPDMFRLDFQYFLKCRYELYILYWIIGIMINYLDIKLIFLNTSIIKCNK